MKKLALVLGLLGATVAAPAQDLLRIVPSDAVLYYRVQDPMETMKSFAADTGLWSDPSKIDGMINGFFDEALAGAEQELGMELGSLGAYLRSMKKLEIALLDLEIGGGDPDIDFVVGLHTPMAESIEQVTLKLLKQFDAVNTMEDGTSEILTQQGFTMPFGRKDDMIVLAGSQMRMREAMGDFTGTLPNALSGSERFRGALADREANTQFYVRLDRVLGIVEAELPSGARRLAGRIMKQLGVFELQDLGYTEGKKGSELRIKASGPVPMFDVIATEAGDASWLKALPHDTVFALTWNGLAEALWRKGADLFLDGKKFPFAPFAKEQIRVFQKELGVTMEELTTTIGIGLAVGVIPDEEGKIDDENFFFSGGVADEQAAIALAQKVIEGFAKRRGATMVSEDLGGWTVFSVKEPEPEEGQESWRRQDLPSAAIGDGRIVIAKRNILARIRDAGRGLIPTLGTAGDLKGIPSRASGYMYVGIGSIAGASGVSGEEMPIRGSASLSLGFDLKPDGIAVRSKQSIGQVWSILPMMMFTTMRASSVEVEIEESEEAGPGGQPERRRRVRRGAPRPAEEGGSGGERPRRQVEIRIGTDPSGQTGVGGSARPVEPAPPAPAGGGGGR